MTFTSYIIWNGSPEIFSFGTFALRWYGLLFALGFLLSQQVLYYIYRKEGKPEQDVDTLTIYMVVATVLGARLGHIIFYQPDIIWNDPLAIFLPFEFNPAFKFTGLQGLASHGGAIGILLALWLYSNYSILFSKSDVELDGKAGEEGSVTKKKKFGLFITRRIKPGQSYLQVLDRIVIVVCLTGALIRMGNFFNSEIIGKPSNGPLSVVFINQVTENISRDQSNGIIQYVEVKKDTALPPGSLGRKPIVLYLFFKPGVSEVQARGFLNYEVKSYLRGFTEFVDEPPSVPLRYEITQEVKGTFAAKVKTFGIARHPAQLYESASCAVLFIFLFWLWSLRKANTPSGRIFGIFMILLWSLRFAYEFLKENQVNFENNMSLNMGQILSIPLVLVGVFVLIRSYRKDPAAL
jgi:phosphatidylglycerol---prolipoprotein diacylglyceryl transferase